uniref:Jacalin-type lectin domain-containing protein n=2 Tax=Ditylum brightwellii TaxID=49249 RepID=A0A6V2Q6H0_9STRA|mmetsp:Transcript_25280/g.33645  ORF Transcript_25280/g.33645 Transcript_25280/m.33645 type:complete len:190 (+) Transcript_25280:94-663(+)
MCRTITATLLLIGASMTNAFAPLQATPRFAVTNTHRTSSPINQQNTALYAIRCEGKTYQLEELEDAETCTTEVFLNNDRTITFGSTDGPIYDSASGQWSVPAGTNDFSMTIRRRYSTGAKNTDMGEFRFDVVREYTGEMTRVGECVGITGIMKDGEAGGEKREVGFFNMIDGTDEKASYAGKAQSLRSS